MRPEPLPITSTAPGASTGQADVIEHTTTPESDGPMTAEQIAAAVAELEAEIARCEAHRVARYLIKEIRIDATDQGAADKLVGALIACAHVPAALRAQLERQVWLEAHLPMPPLPDPPVTLALYQPYQAADVPVGLHGFPKAWQAARAVWSVAPLDEPAEYVVLIYERADALRLKLGGASVLGDRCLAAWTDPRPPRIEAALRLVKEAPDGA